MSNSKVVLLSMFVTNIALLTIGTIINTLQKTDYDNWFGQIFLVTIILCFLCLVDTIEKFKKDK